MSTPAPLRLDPALRQRYRAMVMKKGLAVATDLAEILAGKDKPLAVRDLPALAGKPGMKPEERLRMFLDHLERCRIQLDSDDDAFGRCTVCDADLGALALGELPWADRCQAHAS